MKVSFDKLSDKYKEEVMEIYNYYIENTFAAYPGNKLPSRFFDNLMEEIGDYPAFVVKNREKVVGFCFLFRVSFIRHLKPFAYNGVTVFHLILLSLFLAFNFPCMFFVFLPLPGLLDLDF